MERPPGDNRFFVVEQRGTIRIIENGALRSGNFLDIQSLTNFDGQEQGLLGLAFHPNYSTNHKFYRELHPATWPPADRHCRVPDLRLRPQHADPNSERILLVGKPALRQPQGRPAGLWPRRFSLHRAGGRRQRSAILSTTHKTCSRCWGRCFASAWILLLIRKAIRDSSRQSLRGRRRARPRSLPTACAIPGAFPLSPAATACSSPTSARRALKKLTSCKKAATTAGE